MKRRTLISFIIIISAAVALIGCSDSEVYKTTYTAKGESDNWFVTFHLTENTKEENTSSEVIFTSKEEKVVQNFQYEVKAKPLQTEFYGDAGEIDFTTKEDYETNAFKGTYTKDKSDSFYEGALNDVLVEISWTENGEQLSEHLNLSYEKKLKQQ
ncbi:hypothetical protein LCL89_09760 [Halobacillus yeomjeoni]|uniref:hypothetical protein n=1 Tax=Halobacillus yeomjeoni TaxID=311194 RepID=UPI001CD2274B|nr:hypothetical protein [Halobacillus yeomjeoni]MCA0984331.1 hypothetical protein [Halobacillus yeomjeoni]